MNSLWPAASADCCSVENWSKFLVLTALLEQRISQQVRYIQQRLVSSADSDDDEGRDAAYSSMMSAILDPSSQFSSYHASTCFWLRCLFNGRHGINLRNLVWHGFVLPGDLHPQWIALLITITCEFEHVVQSQFKVASHNLDAECAATPAIMKQRAVQICSIYHGVANTNTNDLGNEFVRIVEAEHDLCNQERQFCRIGQSMRESFLSIYNDGSSSSSSVGACFAEPQTAAVAEDLHQMLTETLRQLAGVQEQPAQTSRTFQNVKLISFGRQKSSRPPYDMDKIFNCEKLKNPSSSSRKGRTGLDKRLRKEIMSDARARQIVEEAVSYIVRRLDSWDGSGKANLFIGLRCAMGKHRSVTIAEEISSQLRVRQKQTCGPRAQAAVSVQHWALEHPPQPKGRERNLKGSRKRHANVPNVAVRPHEQSNDVTQAEPLDWSDTEEVNLVNFCFQCYSKGKFATFLRVSTVLLEIWLRRLFCRLNSAVVDQSLMTAEVGRYFATLDGYGQRHLHQVVILQSIHSSALSPKLRQTDKQFPNELLTWLTNAQRNLLYDLYLVQAGPALRAKLAHGWVLNRDFMATSCGDPPCPVATFTLAMLASIVENASRSQPNPLFGDHSRIRSLFQVIPQRISSVFLKASPATLFQRLFFHQSERFCRQLRLALQCLHSTLDAFIPMLPRTETDDDRRHNGFELDSKDMCFILEKALCLLEHPDSNSTRNCNIPNEEMTRPTMRVIVRAKVASRLKFVVRDVIVALQDCCSRISGSQPNQQARAPPRMVSLPEAIDVELWACARKLGMDRTSVERGPQTEVEHPAISGGAIALLGDCRRLLEHMLNHYRVLAHRAVTRTARTGHRNMLVRSDSGTELYVAADVIVLCFLCLLGEGCTRRLCRCWRCWLSSPFMRKDRQFFRTCSIQAR